MASMLGAGAGAGPSSAGSGAAGAIMQALGAAKGKNARGGRTKRAAGGRATAGKMLRGEKVPKKDAAAVALRIAKKSRKK